VNVLGPYFVIFFVIRAVEQNLKNVGNFSSFKKKIFYSVHTFLILTGDFVYFWNFDQK